ncbi:hypothetical protein BLOT_010459 [Blomia tropicalis]|nr:hypothetical protein BLOT_010459 [Blomia tropicalis]
MIIIIHRTHLQPDRVQFSSVQLFLLLLLLIFGDIIIYKWRTMVGWRGINEEMGHSRLETIINEVEKIMKQKYHDRLNDCIW